MAGLTEQARWENEIYRIEENDPVHGGENGVTNKPTKQLANRTRYLKQEVDKRASPTQIGRVQLTNDTGLDSESLALTAKAGKKLAQQIAQNTVAIAQKVSIANAETITGEKTFTRQLKAYAGIRLSSSQANANAGHYVDFNADANTAWCTFKTHTLRFHSDGNVSVDNKKIYSEANKPPFTAITEKPTTLDGYATRFNGVPYIQSTSGWTAIEFGVNQGSWRMEFNPASDNANERRLNFLYRNNGTDVYLRFPSIGTGQTVAYQSWVDSRIQSIINASPSNLDTLKELADALGNDPNFSRTILTKINGVETKAATAQTAANNANNNANGRVSKSGDTMTGNLEINNASSFVRGKKGTTNSWYVGKGSSGSNDTSFYNYAYNYGIVLQSDKVVFGKPAYVGDKAVHHAGLDYVRTEAANYGGLIIDRPARNDAMFIEANANRFALIRRNRANSQNINVIYTPEANGMIAYQASDKATNLNTLRGSHFFKCTGDATGMPTNWARGDDYNGFQADGDWQRFQFLVGSKDNIAIRVNDSDSDVNAWSAWSLLLTKNNVAVLTGTIAHGGTIPLPAGFTEDQCKWMVSIANSNKNNTPWDMEENKAHLHFRLECWTNGRTVHARQFRHDTGKNNYHDMTANYIIIGVK